MGSTTTRSVLVVPGRAIAHLDLRDGLTCDPLLTRQFIEAVRHEGETVPRGDAESDVRLLQPIPLTCVQTGERALVLPGDDREPGDRLLDLYALWVGGHIEEADRSENDPVTSCLLREVREELCRLPLPPPRLVGLVVDRSHGDRPVHVGIVHHVRVDDTAAVQALEGPPNRGHRGSAKTALIALERLREIAGRLEPWSRFLLADEDLWRPHSPGRLTGLPPLTRSE